MKKITPLDKYILIEPQEEIEQTKSGIYLPETDKSRSSNKGVVVAVGANKDFKVKDVVVYRTYAATELDQDGLLFQKKNYLIVKVEDILAKYE